MQDIEFTIEDGRLYFLQSRSGKRTPRAALAILIELVRERIIDEADGARRAAEIDIEAASVTRFTGDAKAIARGVPASTGVASGRAAFDSESAALLAKSGDPVILIRTDTSTDDIAGFAAAAGVLTAIGGRTAHAAVVARQLGKVCVVGCSALTVNSAERSAIISGQNIAEGAWISLDGDTGAVFIGKREIVIDRPLAAIQEVDRWMAEAKSRQSQRKSPGS
jgi:pyruvate,orthophosphate dikinase